MAFLEPHFDPDIFVSYSHGLGPAGTGSPLKTWTNQFLNDVQGYLHAFLDNEELGRVRLWWDKDIDPTADLTDELRLMVRSAGILMIVMSPRYLTSTWCRNELEWFRDQIEDRRKHRGRIVLVRAAYTDTSEWPEFLRGESGHGSLGFQFHDPKPGAWPYTIGGSDLNRNEYIQQVNSLISALKRRLIEMRNEHENAARKKSPPVHPVNAGRRVYVHMHKEHTEANEETRRLLIDHGLVPWTINLSAGRDIRDMEKEPRLRINAMKLCEAVILVRQANDDTFDYDMFDIGISEREQAQSARGSPLPCAILDLTGQPLRMEMPDIAHFDMTQEGWQQELIAWLNTHRTTMEGGA